MEPINFNIRSSYNFGFYATNILTAGLAGATVMAIMDTASANREINTQVLHAQIWPQLPAGSCPNDPNGYDYVKVKTTSGETAIYGLPWIIPSSVQQIDSSTITITVPNATPGDIPRINAALAANGYSGMTFDIS